MLDSLRIALNGFINRETDLGAFEDWVVGNIQAVLDSRDVESIRIIDTLDALIIELNEGLIGEQDVFREAEALVKRSESTVLPPKGVPVNHHGVVVVLSSASAAVSPVVQFAPPTIVRRVWDPAAEAV